MKLLCLFFILVFSAPLLAFNTTSVTWQKIALEEKIQKKYISSIAHLLKEGQYLIEVEAAVDEPSGPNFGNEPVKGVKVSDVSLSDSRGDYVAFSKMGLEVPVVDKFLDEQKTQLTNLYRYNEAYDLFKNIEGLTVTVFLSDKIPTELQDMVKGILQNIKINVADIKPNVKFESMAMEWTAPEEVKKPTPEVKPEEKEPKIWTKDWLEWASRWGNGVGLILGSLIICAFALYLFNKWKSFMEAYTAQTHNKEEAVQEEQVEEEIPQEEIPSEELLDPAMMTEEDEVATAKGYERFQQCLEQHPDEAVNIIRNLVNEESEMALLTLRSIAQQATTEEMEKLLHGLSEAQRDKWKSYLKDQLDTPQILLANKNLFQEVVKAFLVPSRIKDNELLNIVMDLNVKNTVEFMEQHETHVGILMNLLSPGLINRILGESSDKSVEKWLMAGATFNMKNIEQQVSSLKEALTTYLDNYGPKPFLQRIAAMIPSASPSREKTLYRALAQSGNTGMVVDVARKSFPSELVLKLPAAFLKESIQAYPMHKRLELICSQTPEVKAMLTDIVAEPGSAARDMMDMEMDNLERDASQKSLIESRTEEIWQEFVKNSRVILEKNASYNGITQKLIQEWSEKLKTHLQRIEGGKAA